MEAKDGKLEKSSSQTAMTKQVRRRPWDTKEIRAPSTTVHSFPNGNNKIVDEGPLEKVIEKVARSPLG